MDQEKISKIIELEAARRAAIIYEKIEVEYDPMPNIAEDIQKAKEELAKENNIPIKEVENALEYEFLYSHKLAEAINSLCISYYVEFENLVLESWKIITMLKDLLYAELLDESLKDTIKVSLDTLTEEQIATLEKQQEDITRGYIYVMADKKTIRVLSEIFDAPLIKNVFDDSGIKVVNDIITTAEAIEAAANGKHSLTFLKGYKNIRKIKNAYNARYEALKGQFEDALTEIKSNDESSYSEDTEFLKKQIILFSSAMQHIFADAFADDGQAIAVIPKHFDSTNSKEFKHITRISRESHYLLNEPFSLNLGNKRKEIETKIMISAEGESFKPDLYDSIIHDAIATLRNSGNAFITIDMIYRKMNGYNGRQKASDTQYKAIKSRINRMRKVYITAERRLLSGSNKATDDVIIDSEVPLINASIRTTEINGKFTEGYILYGLPILYDRAMENKHIQKIDDRYLNLKREELPDDLTMSASTEVTSINNYLLKRIFDMKSNRRQTRLIRIDTVRDLIATIDGVEKLNRGKRARVKQWIFNILDVQVYNGLIERYELKSTAKNTESIEIFFSKAE